MTYNQKLSAIAQGTVNGVLQVVQTVKTDAFASSFGGQWGDITGFSASITPSSASNKILIIIDAKFMGDTDVSVSRVRLMRDTTAIYLGDASSNRPRSSGPQNYTTNAGSGGANVLGSGITYLDSPSTTSQITYKLQGGGDGNSTLFFFNRSELDRDTTYYDTRTASSITLMEISS